MKKPETECPDCKGPLEWRVVRDGLGSPTANGLCRKCCLVLRGREAPKVTLGREMVKSGEMDGISCLDYRMTRLPADVQLGILREQQHGKTRKRKK